MLQDESQSGGSLGGVHIENGDTVLPGRKIGQHKYGAIFRLTGSPENATEKFGARQRFWAIGNQQEWRSNRGLCAGERGLVFFDHRFDRGEICGHGGNGILPQSRRVAMRRHFEVAPRSGSERGLHIGTHVRRALAGLRGGRHCT